MTQRDRDKGNLQQSRPTAQMHLSIALRRLQQMKEGLSPMTWPRPQAKGRLPKSTEAWAGAINSPQQVLSTLGLQGNNNMNWGDGV